MARLLNKVRLRTFLLALTVALRASPRARASLDESANEVHRFDSFSHPTCPVLALSPSLDETLCPRDILRPRLHRPPVSTPYAGAQIAAN